MTIRAKVLLFAVMAIGLVCLMGVNLSIGAQQGQLIRKHVTAIQEQISSYERLRALAWPYLNQLVQVRQAEGDTAPLRRELLERVEAEMRRLEDSQAHEMEWVPGRTAEHERQERRELQEALRSWAQWAEARVNDIPPGATRESVVEWSLYTKFEQDVGRRLMDVQQSEQDELAGLRVNWDESVRLGQQLALFIPGLCIVLVVALAFAILAPLRRSLRELLTVAERIGRGDFDVRTPVAGHDELATLARAFDRMAGELRDSLSEKQRLMKAEAEASEREARRYNALLEETVRTRTAELAQANVQLHDSLQQLQATQEQLLFADRLASLGQLAAGVGHEINNPLAFILSNLRYVQRELKNWMGAPSEEERQELLTALSEASEGAERVRLIVQDLKMLSRPDDVALGPVDVAAVVRGAVKMAWHEIRDRSRLVEACDGVPPVRANAAHAIEPGRVRENEIRVAARLSAPGRVTVEVRDSGSGIPAEYLRRVFDPFFTTKPVGMGTGLGLSVCHRIITALGGEILVESEPGRGTCFFIILPVAEASRASEQSAA